MRTDEVMTALQAQRRHTLDLLGELPSEAWEARCGTWRVREVATHLLTVDAAAVSGRLLPLLRTARSRDDVERWNDEVVARAAAPPAELLEELERTGERLAARVQRIPGPLWRLRVRTVFGRHRLHLLPARRVLDEWVHGVDIRRAAGLPGGHPASSLPVLAGAVLDALPALSLPGLTVSAGVVRLVVGTAEDAATDPHSPRVTWAIDLARRQYGPRVTSAPDAVVRLGAPALALLAEGRPTDGYGEVAITGDEGLAQAVVAALAGR
jgi:uncharacterized protein (TIGR03083 family)